MNYSREWHNPKHLLGSKYEITRKSDEAGESEEIGDGGQERRMMRESS